MSPKVAKKATAKKAATKKAATARKTADGKFVNKGRTCSVRGCGNDARARGLCSKHHTAWWRANVPGAAESTREASRRYSARIRAEKKKADK